MEMEENKETLAELTPTAELTERPAEPTESAAAVTDVPAEPLPHHKNEVAFSITNESALQGTTAESADAQSASDPEGGASSTQDGADTAKTAGGEGKPRKKKKSKKNKDTAPKGLWAQLKEYTNSDDDITVSLDFRALLGGEPLPRLFRRNWLFILVIVLFTCCYVSTRYMMNNAVLENRALADTLLDRRYKALTINSELLERTLSSHIEDHLRDSTIHTPTEQAFPLKADE